MALQRGKGGRAGAAHGPGCSWSIGMQPEHRDAIGASGCLLEHRDASRRFGTSAGGASRAPENPHQPVKTHRERL